jgi:hypothetical protein
MSTKGPKWKTATSGARSIAGTRGWVSCLFQISRVSMVKRSDMNAHLQQVCRLRGSVQVL